MAAAIIECMFDTLPLDPAAFSDADDAAVVAAIEDWARIEAAAGAQDASALEEIKRIAIKQLRMIAIGVAGWRSGRLRLRRNGTPVVKSPGNELEFCLGDRAVGSAAWLARLPNPPGRRPT